jgi:hypothetical protein
MRRSAHTTVLKQKIAACGFSYGSQSIVTTCTSVVTELTTVASRWMNVAYVAAMELVVQTSVAFHSVMEAAVKTATAFQTALRMSMCVASVMPNREMTVIRV